MLDFVVWLVHFYDDVLGRQGSDRASEGPRVNSALEEYKLRLTEAMAGRPREPAQRLHLGLLRLMEVLVCSHGSNYYDKYLCWFMPVSAWWALRFDVEVP